MKTTRDYPLLFIVTLAYFVLGFVNIALAALALICILLPFVLILITKRKLWCMHFCPRSYWLRIAGRIGRNRMPPGWVVSRKMRKAVLIYFIINFFFITMSSVAVTLGKVAPMDIIRFFIVIPTNWQLYQILDFGDLPPLLLHLSYRLYSVMLSSTIAGTVLAVLFKPQTWCAICPINTLSTSLVKKVKS